MARVLGIRIINNSYVIGLPGIRFLLLKVLCGQETLVTAAKGPTTTTTFRKRKLTRFSPDSSLLVVEQQPATAVREASSRDEVLQLQTSV
ncbi:hypothetical protein B9Z55_001257 [Caenorhabditis nigoni]|uniref:Uncharacterized protein n=1 Tax=Caenorhabditis nigoni TaxID=1611254 RepID=A0A2G5VEY6_9PELO|nr:hypothetical protein B9Z55_001257 [Caenorhabditis nigoni]